MTAISRIEQDHASLATQDFEPQGYAIRRLSPFIGAEVIGLDLKQAQDETVQEQLRALLREHGALFFPGQHLSPEQQLAATAIWGAPRTDGDHRGGSPLPGVDVEDDVQGIAEGVSYWHADEVAGESPAVIRLLQALDAPSQGVDLFWASTEAAYARLSPALKTLADELSAVHAVTPVTLDGFLAPRSRFRWAEHPLVRAHPDTGRRALFVDARFTREIVGLLPTESAHLLDMFLNHIALPDHVVRYPLAPGALAVWDSRSSVRYAADARGSAHHRLQSTGAAPQDLAAGAKD